MLEAQQKNGRRVEVLENEPAVGLALLSFWRGFWELNSCRQSGFGPSPLGILEIIAWFEINGIVENKYEYFYYIKYLDSLYLEWCKEKQDEHT